MTLSKEMAEKLLKSVESLETRVKTAEEKATANSVNAPVYGNRSDSLEAKTKAYFGASSLKQLVQTNYADPKFAHVPVECKLALKGLKDAFDTARFTAQYFYGADRDKFTKTSESIAHVKNLLSTPFGKDVLAPMVKAFGSTVSGAGDETVPTIIANTFIDEYELDKLVEGRMNQVNMPSNPYQISVKTGVKKARKIAENTAITDVNFGTSSLTFTANKLGEYYIIPEELTEDSALDFIAMAKDELVRSHLRAVESAILNGDDDGTHIDSDTQALGADVAEKLWKGLRRQALANAANGGTQTFSGAAVTKQNLQAMRANMGKFGVDPKQLIWIVGPAVYAQLLGLTDVSTLDKMGPLATVLRGALAAYMGIPIVVSEHMREDLNASGVYDGITTTTGGILLVNESRWHVGTRRPITMALSRDLPGQDRDLMAAYQRKDFVGMPQSATEVSVCYGFNVLV